MSIRLPWAQRLACKAAWSFAALILAWVLMLAVGAAEKIPPAPKNHFNDYARVVSPGVATELNTTLEAFEKRSSSQIVVVIYPRMESDSSIEDYTVRVAQAWKVGGAKKDNGAVLFVFIENRQLYIQVGYGLEGAVPDATAKDIIENRIKPNFRAGNFDAGMRAGVAALIQAAEGEYQGTGRTVAQGARGNNAGNSALLVFIVFIFIIFMIGRLNRRARGQLYTGGGRRRYRHGPVVWPIGGSGWGGGGWSGGGGGGGGFSGGSFSGGGGSFGGGGAGGSW